MDIRIINFEWDEIYPIYFKKSYLCNISGEYGWMAGYIDNELLLIIPYVINRKYIFKFATLQSAPIFIKDSCMDKNEKDFLNGCIQKLASMGVDYIAQSPAHAIFRSYPSNSSAIKFGSYILNINQPEDFLWKKFHSKHRNVILNAINKGVQIQIGSREDLFTVHDILVETMGRSKILFMKFVEFKKIIESFGENILIFLAYYQGKPIGCGIFPYSKYSSYYQYGGSMTGVPLGTMNLLHWEAIKYFKTIGVERYDFVGARLFPEPGSKYEGIQRFKERFGSQLEVGYLWKMPLSHKYLIYRLLKKIQISKSLDIIDQEMARLR